MPKIIEDFSAARSWTQLVFSSFIASSSSSIIVTPHLVFYPKLFLVTGEFIENSVTKNGGLRKMIPSIFPVFWLLRVQLHSVLSKLFIYETAVTLHPGSTVFLLLNVKPFGRYMYIQPWNSKFAFIDILKVCCFIRKFSLRPTFLIHKINTNVQNFSFRKKSFLEND